MKRSLFIAALASGLPLQVFAQSTPADLARSKNCLACHSVNAKIVGPAFKDVAQKYKNQKDVEDKLAQRVLKGSSGVWGAIPMPANAQVSEAEARMLVKWVLIQK
ncbi:MAG TPA: c-type cytochrome [Herbaspirillum sp.]|nr:c-type cytochrome [Herbaspirillum sp.]